MPKTAKEIREEAWQETNKEEKKTKKDEKSFYIAVFPNLIDLVEDGDGNLQFLVINPQTGELETPSVVEIGDKIYKTPPRASLPMELTFPNKKEVFKYFKDRNNSNPIIYNITDDTDDTEHSTILTNAPKNLEKPELKEFDVNLYNDIMEYYNNASQLPDDKYYDLLTLWTFHTYAVEKSDFSPIVYFLGLPEKGKSRTLKSMTYVSYRGIRKISVTDAQILRDCTNLRATITLDMMDLWGKIEKAGSEDVFLNRPEKGATVSRVNRPERGAFQDTDYYSVFGPTALASNEVIHDILETRAIPIVMRNSKRKFKTKITPKLAQDLKNRLTAWRAATYLNIYDEVEAVVDGRLGDITMSLVQLVKYVNPAKYEVFIKLIKEIEEKKKKEKSDNINGQVLRAVINSRELIKNGMLKCQFLTNEFNKEKSDREKYSSRKVLNRLKTMGFESTVFEDGSAAIFWNRELIDGLCQEYGLDFDVNFSMSKSSEQSVSSESSDTMGQLEELDQLDLEKDKNEPSF